MSCRRLATPTWFTVQRATFCCSRFVLVTEEEQFLNSIVFGVFPECINRPFLLPPPPPPWRYLENGGQVETRRVGTDVSAQISERQLAISILISINDGAILEDARVCYY